MHSTPATTKPCNSKTSCVATLATPGHMICHNHEAKSSDIRRALAASVTRRALERARAEREPPISGFDRRQKVACPILLLQISEGIVLIMRPLISQSQEAREGLNQLGLASVPKDKTEKVCKTPLIHLLCILKSNDYPLMELARVGRGV